MEFRQNKRRWRPDLPRSRQRQWYRRLGRAIQMFLGLSFKGTSLEGFDRLVEDNIVAVTEAKKHANRLIQQAPYRIVALPASC